MKRIILFIITFSCFLAVNAQNWQLLNPNYKYNFEINNTGFITHQIFADSFDIIDFDTVFYLNRIVTVYDTSANTQYEIEFKIKNQPQFLMRQVVKDTNNFYSFEDTINFVIKPEYHFGQPWNFRISPNINAVVSFEGVENVLGQADSVKYISLSDGRTIKISKNYGIYYFEQEKEIFIIL